MRVSVFSLLLLTAVVVLDLSGPQVSATEHPHPYGKLCPNPKARIDVADDCVTNLLMFGNEDFKPPMNETAMDALCEHMMKQMKCTIDYVHDCMEPFPRQLLRFGVNGFTKAWQANCDPKVQREDFMKSMPCLKAHAYIGHRLTKVDIMSLEWVRDNLGTKQQLPGVCCTHFFFRNTLKARMTKECTTEFGAASAAESGEFFNAFLADGTGELMNFMCGKYSNLDACEANLPELMSQIHEHMAAVDNNEDVHPDSHSIFFPVLDVFTMASKAQRRRR